MRRGARGRTLLLSVVLAAGCASIGGSRASLPPLDPAECARLATGIWPNGRSAISDFDSMYTEAVRNPNRRASGADSLRLEKQPALANGAFINQAMRDAYPRFLLDMNRGGVTTLALLVHADGTAGPVRVYRSSGELPLDEASVRMAGQFRFSPGIYRGCPVFVFTLMPITWVPGPPPRP